MVRRIPYPPDCMEEHSILEHCYFELSDDRGVYGYAAVLPNPPLGQFHLEVQRYGPAVARCMKRDWPALMAELNLMGLYYLTVCYRAQNFDERKYKILCEFGFAEPALAWVSTRRI